LANIHLLSNERSVDENGQGLAIVFVHGLGGHYKKTWMDNPNNDETLWPLWLSEDVGTPVWSIEYGASMSAWKSSAMPIIDQGKVVLEALSSHPVLSNRPILFIVHSMGGLVVKAAIQNAKSNSVKRHKNLVQNFKGVFFFATPHSGSHLATLMKHLSLVARTNTQVSDMSAHDANLLSLNDSFMGFYDERSADFEVRSYIESNPVQVGKRVFGLNFKTGALVVPPGMGAIHVRGESPIKLDADHISIVKLKYRDQMPYTSVLTAIQTGIRSRKWRTEWSPDKDKLIGAEYEYSHLMSKLLNAQNEYQLLRVQREIEFAVRNNIDDVQYEHLAAMAAKAIESEAMIGVSGDIELRCDSSLNYDSTHNDDSRRYSVSFKRKAISVLTAFSLIGITIGGLSLYFPRDTLITSPIKVPIGSNITSIACSTDIQCAGILESQHVLSGSVVHPWYARTPLGKLYRREDREIGDPQGTADKICESKYGISESRFRVGWKQVDCEWDFTVAEWSEGRLKYIDLGTCEHQRVKVIESVECSYNPANLSD